MAPPLNSEELMVFATDLMDNLRTHSFALGRLMVFVTRQS